MWQRRHPSNSPTITLVYVRPYLGADEPLVCIVRTEGAAAQLSQSPELRGLEVVWQPVPWHGSAPRDGDTGHVVIEGSVDSPTGLAGFGDLSSAEAYVARESRTPRADPLRVISAPFGEWLSHTIPHPELPSRAVAIAPVPTSRWFREWTEDQRMEFASRFQRMAEAGADVDGEARLVDALAARQSRVLDAGCGSGRMAAYLLAQGHHPVGVDLDPMLIEFGQDQYPGLALRCMDLLNVSPLLGTFDLVASAGNVMVFLEPGTERSVVEALASVLRPGGRAVFGFATDRAYTHDQLDQDAAAVGWTREARWATWQMDPFTDDADWGVSLYRA